MGLLAAPSKHNAIFAGLPAGGLAVGAFRQGAAAADANDRIIYSAGTGPSFFDVDGAGGAAQVRFAALDPGLALNANDLMLI